MSLHAWSSGAIFRGAAAKSAAGIGTPENSKAHQRLAYKSAFFVPAETMVGRMGRSYERRVSFEACSSNPVRPITLRLEPESDGENEHHSKEPVMALHQLAPDICAQLEQIQNQITEDGQDHQLRLSFVRDLIESIQSANTDTLRRDFLCGVAIDLCLGWESLTAGRTQCLARQLDAIGGDA